MAKHVVLQKIWLTKKIQNGGTICFRVQLHRACNNLWLVQTLHEGRSFKWKHTCRYEMSFKTLIYKNSGRYIIKERIFRTHSPPLRLVTQIYCCKAISTTSQVKITFPCILLKLTILKNISHKSRRSRCDCMWNVPFQTG